ncbi:ArsR family transcriptional regulator [Halobacteriales archaeon SW_7_68_16]|nr:MAG: ArsR family transcriptional regulator [Halobacteriales archaeon SW_7_68_16]
MVRAYVMIDAVAGESEALIAGVRECRGVEEAHIVAGDHDIIAELEVDQVYEVLNTVSTGIRNLDAVADTKTYVSLG